MPEIDPTALGHEFGTLAGLVVQGLLLLAVGLLFALVRWGGLRVLGRVGIVVVLILAAAACGWVGYESGEYRDYIRGKADDPIATSKLAAARDSLGPTMIGSGILLAATAVGSCAAVRFGRSPKPNPNPGEPRS